MDADSWIARLSSTSKRFQYAFPSQSSDMFMGFEDIEVDDDTREEIQCPFCSGYFDLAGLYRHIGEEHPVDAKNGECPVCGARVGVDMVTHITLHHGNIFKVQRKRKSRKGGSISMLSLLRRELQGGNLQSHLGGLASSYVVSSSNVAPDPLLSSFILPTADDLGIDLSNSSVESPVTKKSTGENISERKTQSPPLSTKDKEERSRRSEFVQGILLSTILDNNL